MNQNLTKSRDTSPSWMRSILVLAAIYNLAWGTVVVLLPERSLQWCGFPEPVRYPEIWQCLGMVIGVYGIGYGIAALDPVRHWSIVFVGLLGKVFGPIGIAKAVLEGRLPPSAVRTCLTNDVIWWVPFVLILWHARNSLRRQQQ